MLVQISWLPAGANEFVAGSLTESELASGASAGSARSSTTVQSVLDNCPAVAVADWRASETEKAKFLAQVKSQTVSIMQRQAKVLTQVEGGISIAMLNAASQAREALALMNLSVEVNDSSKSGDPEYSGYTIYRPHKPLASPVSGFPAQTEITDAEFKNAEQVFRSQLSARNTRPDWEKLKEKYADPSLPRSFHQGDAYLWHTQYLPQLGLEASAALQDASLTTAGVSLIAAKATLDEVHAIKPGTLVGARSDGSLGVALESRQEEVKAHAIDAALSAVLTVPAGRLLGVAADSASIAERAAALEATYARADAQAIMEAEASLVPRRQLTEREQLGFLAAHHKYWDAVGRDGGAAMVGNYTPGQNVVKGLKLRRAGMPKEDARTLLDGGNAGHRPDYAPASRLSPSTAPAAIAGPQITAVIETSVEKFLTKVGKSNSTLADSIRTRMDEIQRTGFIGSGNSSRNLPGRVVELKFEGKSRIYACIDGFYDAGHKLIPGRATVIFLLAGNSEQHQHSDIESAQALAKTKRR